MAAALWLVCFVVFGVLSRVTGMTFRLVKPPIMSVLGGLLILLVIVFVCQTISAIVSVIVGSIEAIPSAMASGHFSVQSLPWPVKLVICTIGAPLIYRSIRDWLDKRYHERYLIKESRWPWRN